MCPSGSTRSRSQGQAAWWMAGRELGQGCPTLRRQLRCRWVWRPQPPTRPTHPRLRQQAACPDLSMWHSAHHCCSKVRVLCALQALGTTLTHCTCQPLRLTVDSTAPLALRAVRHSLADDRHRLLAPPVMQAQRVVRRPAAPAASHGGAPAPRRRQLQRRQWQGPPSLGWRACRRLLRACGATPRRTASLQATWKRWSGTSQLRGGGSGIRPSPPRPVMHQARPTSRLRLCRHSKRSLSWRRRSSPRSSRLPPPALAGRFLRRHVRRGQGLQLLLRLPPARQEGRPQRRKALRQRARLHHRRPCRPPCHRRQQQQPRPAKR